MNDKILELIKRQITLIQRSNEKYKDLKIVIANEQQFAKIKDKDRNTIYIVVRFLTGSLIYGVSVLPASMSVIAEKNSLLLCQQLLLDYAQTYNLTMDKSGKIKQTYTSPEVVNNFGEVYDGLRSLFTLSGTFQISETAIDFVVVDSDTNEVVLTLTKNLGFSNYLDTQPFSNDIYTKSESKFCSLTLNFSMQLTANVVCSKALEVITKQRTPNETFYFDIVFDNGSALRNIPFKLANFEIEKQMANFPVISLTFTN